ncbi:hypothetical protein [Leptospira alstonii]|uniref:hypothetical protein n=1 Tax=Leptospira alstonii TaxID=28452 RepID=UPI003B847CA3
MKILRILQYGKTTLLLLCCCVYFDSYDLHRSVFAEDGDVGKGKCPPVLSDREPLVLDLSVSDRNLNILLSKLRNEKIQIVDIEKISKKQAQVRIEILESEFQTLFSGSVEYSLVEYSSHSGTYCQRYIRSYRIPFRFKKFIWEIRVPDPQVGWNGPKSISKE